MILSWDPMLDCHCVIYFTYGANLSGLLVRTLFGDRGRQWLALVFRPFCTKPSSNRGLIYIMNKAYNDNIGIFFFFDTQMFSLTKHFCRIRPIRANEFSTLFRCGNIIISCCIMWCFTRLFQDCSVHDCRFVPFVASWVVMQSNHQGPFY